MREEVFTQMEAECQADTIFFCKINWQDRLVSATSLVLKTDNSRSGCGYFVFAAEMKSFFPEQQRMYAERKA